MDAVNEVDKIIDDLWLWLDSLVRIPTVNRDDAESKELTRKCRAEIIQKFKEAGIPAKEWAIKYQGRDFTPLVYADYKAPGGNKPTVLIYSHYDVQPAKKEDDWTTEPFVPVNKADGVDFRKYGRGAADDKSGIAMHLGVAKAFKESKIPVNLKLVFEGEEETNFGTLDEYLADKTIDHPEFKADVIVVADTGNIELGKPTLTTTLRGYAAFDVEVHTMDSAVHSGSYGGPAPDAFMVLARLLASLHNAKGDVAVAGLANDDAYPFAPVNEQHFRANAHVRDGVPLIGTGTLAQRLGGRASINVVGLEGVKSMAEATNILCPRVKARISVRLAPSQDPEKARVAIEKHLNSVHPWNVKVDVTCKGVGPGFKVNTGGKYFKTAANAIKKSYDGKETQFSGEGGSVPLVNALQRINPTSDVVLWGCEEPRTSIHGTNESVSKSELRHMTISETLLLQDIATSVRG